jgi:WD40 repeat protein
MKTKTKGTNNHKKFRFERSSNNNLLFFTLFRLEFFRVLCICGNDVHLATGGLDRTIHVWLLQTGKIHQTLIGHSKGVWAVKFLSKTLLISGAYDCTLKVMKFVLRLAFFEVFCRLDLEY